MSSAESLQPPTRVLKIGLLVCGAPSAAIAAIHGVYPEIYSRLLEKSFSSRLAQCDGGVQPSVRWSLDSFDVVNKQEYPHDAEVDDFDAFIVTGSAASAYENLDWINKLIGWVGRLIKEKPSIRIIGICFGHQIIARAVGGSCIPNSSIWEIGPTTVALNQSGAGIFGTEHIIINESHRDHVPISSIPLSSGFTIIGSTKKCPNQGMVLYYDQDHSGGHRDELRRIHVLTLQGHPEIENDHMARIVEARSASGVYDSETLNEYESRKGKPHDGTGIIGRAIWSVLLS